MDNEELLKSALDAIEQAGTDAKELGREGINTLCNLSIAASLLVIARNSVNMQSVADDIESIKRTLHNGA